MASISGMGEDFELPISKAKAARLLAPHPLPRMGYQADLVSKLDKHGLPCGLYIGNFGGRFVIFSPNDRKANWAAQYGYTDKGEPVPAQEADESDSARADGGTKCGAVGRPH